MLGAPASDVIPRKLCGREFGVHIGVANVSCCCCCSRASFASVEIIIARRHGGGVWWWQTHAHTECNTNTHTTTTRQGVIPFANAPLAHGARLHTHTHTHTFDVVVCGARFLSVKHAHPLCRGVSYGGRAGIRRKTAKGMQTPAIRDDDDGDDDDDAKTALQIGAE